MKCLTWRISPWKWRFRTWKPSFSGYMLNLKGVFFFLTHCQCKAIAMSCGLCCQKGLFSVTWHWLPILGFVQSVFSLNRLCHGKSTCFTMIWGIVFGTFSKHRRVTNPSGVRILCWSNVNGEVTLPKFQSAPMKKWWLEDYFLLKTVPFQWPC